MLNKSGLFKLLSIIVVLVLLVYYCGGFLIVAYPTAADFAGGSGTEADPYLIETKYHLTNIRSNLSACYKLISDIVFSDTDFSSDGAFYNDGRGWEPIGNSTNPFIGSLDGNGHSIYNLQITCENAQSDYYGLFAYGKDGSFNDLSVLDSKYSITTSLKECIVGGILGGCNRKVGINGCVFDGELVVESISDDIDAVIKVGGVIGEIDSSFSTYTSIISNCVNKSLIQCSTINNYAYAGGICGSGESYPKQMCSFENNINNGAINAISKRGTSNVGGIIGYSSCCSISSSSNKGCIFASGSTGGGYAIAGGVVGFGSDTHISNCINSGEVSSISAEYPQSGGICGNNYGKSLIKWSINKGNISSDISSFGVSFTGGVSGCNNGHIVESYNCANIFANGSHAKADITIGGICGKNNSQGVVLDCFNCADIFANHSVRYGSISNGGIVAANHGTIEACYNVGAQNSSATYVRNGGIVSCNYGSIENTYYLNIISKGVSYGDDTTNRCTFEEMSEETTFGGFDFSGIWEYIDNNAYPYPTLINAEYYLSDVTYTKGDFDGDGNITVSDALAALRIAAKLVAETPEAIAIGDIDGDGVIAVNDALAILRVAAKLADSL